MNATNEPSADLEDPQWFIFTDDGRGSTVMAPTMTKAISNFKKNKINAKRGEIVGVIAALDSVVPGSQIQSTYVYGVICCAANQARSEEVG